MATDNLFVSDTDKFYLQPVQSDAPTEPPAAASVTSTVTIEVCFWQSVSNKDVLWYKARPAEGDWTPITRLLMPDFDRSGNYHQGDISIDVPISITVEIPDSPPASTTPEPTPASTPEGQGNTDP